MSRRWSKLKSRVEDLWSPALPLAIHANVWVKRTRHFTFDEPRHWIILDRRIIWDFPAPYMRPNPPRGKRIETWEEAYGWSHGDGESSTAAILLRQYLDRERERLFDALDHDHWDLGDILRAADRRIGRERLAAWSAGFDCQSPARMVVERRLEPAPA